MLKINNIKIRTKLYLVLAISILSIVSIVGYSLYISNNYHKFELKNEQTSQELITIKSIINNGLLFNSASNVKFINPKGKKPIQTMENSLNKLNNIITNLEGEKIKPNIINEFNVFYKSSSSLLYAFKENDLNLNQLKANVTNWRALKSKLLKINKEIEVEKSEIRAFLKEEYEKDSMLIIAFSFIFLLISTIFTVSLIISIRKELSLLKNGVDNLNTGNSQVIEITGTNEIGEISLELNKFINHLKDENNKTIDNVKEINKVLENVNNGILNKQINIESNNEAINVLSQNINQTIKKLNDIFTKIQNELRKMATYDYSNEISLHNEFGKYNSLLSSLLTAIKGNSDIMGYLKNYANTLESNTSILDSSLDDFSKKNTEQVAYIEEISASIEEISGNIKNTSDNATKLEVFSNEVKESNEESSALVNDTTVIMEEIVEQQKNIANSLQLIENIAFQTNILSLNAAVEAATAGEAGKGFSVVAQEVRNLANRSAEAAKQIKSIIDEANKKTEDGQLIVNKMKEQIDILNERIEQQGEMITDINTSSTEQQLGISLISENMSNIDMNTQKNSQTVQELNDLSQSISSITSNLKNIVNTTKINESLSGYKETHPAIQLNFAKLKMAHIDFKDVNLNDESIRAEDIKTHTNCILAQMLYKLEEKLPAIKNSQNYRLMNEYHENVHSIVIDWIKRGRQEPVTEISTKVEENTQLLFKQFELLQKEISQY